MTRRRTPRSRSKSTASETRARRPDPTPLDVAAGILRRAARTEAELEARLTAKGYQRSTAVAAVDRCRELGWVGDERLAFRDLVDDWRRARALSLVTRTRLPLSQVSEAVGYADQSVFTRAFQRWYGDPPLVYRQRDAGQAVV